MSIKQGQCPDCTRERGYHAHLHAGHIWTNMACPAYRTLDGDDCNCRRPAPQAEYHLTYMGEVLDVFDTPSGAAIARDNLWRDVLANRLPDFLDADDVERDKGSAYHFPIRKVVVA